MAKAIFNVLFKVIKSVLNILLAPVNLLVVNLFPDFSNMISAFNNGVQTIIGTGLGFFSHLFPPTTRSLIILYLTFLISYYTISYSAHAIIKIFKIIQRIKFW
jgi:hypothetical protein